MSAEHPVEERITPAPGSADATVQVPAPVPSAAELYDALMAGLKAQGLVNDATLTAIARLAERVSELEHHMLGRIGSPSFARWEGITRHDDKDSTRGRSS